MFFHVVLTRSGPEWDGARPLEEQSGWAEHAASIDPWTLRLDGRERG